jgi:hypothetical protein
VSPTLGCRLAPRGDRGRRRCRVSSNSPQSLADYISAICTKSFGSAPAAEAPYLAETMTKMMIDMGISRPAMSMPTLWR